MNSNVVSINSSSTCSSCGGMHREPVYTYTSKNLKSDVSKVFNRLIHGSSQREEMSILKKKSILFQESKSYNFDKAVQIFHKLFEDLKRKGFDVNPVCKEGFLLYYPSIVKALVQSGAKIELLDERKSIFNRRIYNSIYDEHLLEQSLDILTSNGSKLDAPLRMQACFYQPEILRILVKMKADVNLQTQNEFSTPLMLAANNHLIDNVSILVKMGADLFAVNSSLKTAADIARKAESSFEFVFRITLSPLGKTSDYLYRKMDAIIDEVQAELDTHLPRTIRKIVIQYLTIHENLRLFDTSYIKYRESLLDSSIERNYSVFRESVGHFSFILKKLLGR